MSCGQAVRQPLESMVHPPPLFVLLDALAGFAHPKAAQNLSAAVHCVVDGHGFLVLASDEGSELAFVPVDEAGLHRAPGPTRMGDLRAALGTAEGMGRLARDGEIDVEGLAGVPGGLFVVGSSSLKRKRVRAQDEATGRAAVLERLERIERASGGDQRHSELGMVVQVRLKGDGVALSVVQLCHLRPLLLRHPLLRPFSKVPSKDNGLDIEGAAWLDGHVWLGLRGPVLRGWALLARLSHDLDEVELFPVALNGFGIRSLDGGRWENGPEGLFIVSGPTLTHPGPYTLWHWVVPTDGALGQATVVRELGHDSDRPGKVETVLHRHDRALTLVDGVDGGAPAVVVPGY